MKEIKDLIGYLEGIDTLSKTLAPDQKKSLANIISVVLTLIVSLKRDSKLGKVSNLDQE
jgi:hypothetical protein